MRANQKRSERGTVAVVVAISATMIFALCALGVDLGSAFARKRDIQTQADLAALAAASNLPRSATSEALIEAAANSYAAENQVQGQDTATWDFSDSDTSNGFIEYLGSNKLRLFAPKSRVDFWLAPAAGLANGMDVSAVAAVEILSPGKGLPFFISTTCAWDDQTILDQTAGAEIPPSYVPVLSPTSDPPANVKIDLISPTSTSLQTTDAVVPVSLNVKTTTGNGFRDVIKVGFTTEAPSSKHEEFVGLSVTGDTATVLVPDAVLKTEAVWWVRLLEKGNRASDPPRWSAPNNAKPFVVGDPLGPPSGSCDSKSSGNFGSLDLSRDDVNQPSRYLVENMAQGIQHLLKQYPEPRPIPPAGCAGEPLAVTDSGTPDETRQINCLETDTGSDLAQKATEAFITGTAQGTPGRLNGEEHPTQENCDPEKRSENRELEDIPGEPTINNDVLSCFIKNNHSVRDVTKQYGAPADVIDNAIFESPRFFWIPVLVADPAGGAGSYAIVDFRAVFITDQPDGATRENTMIDYDSDNGITMSTNGRRIEKIRVRALNPVSLPPFTADLGPDNTVPYLGSGTKILRLVE